MTNPHALYGEYEPACHNLEVKPLIVGALLGAFLLFAPLAYASTATPIGNPYTDTFQLWSSIAWSIEYIAQEAAAATQGAETALQSVASSLPQLYGQSEKPTGSATINTQSSSLAAAVASFETSVAASSTADTPATVQAVASSPPVTTSQPVIERVVQYEPLASQGFVTEPELSAQLQQLSNSLTSTLNSNEVLTVPAWAPSQAIDQLDNVTITNANLSASEIPALDYLSLSGGSLSGDLSVAGNATTTGTSYFTGNIGIGTSSSQDALAVNGSTFLPNISAPSITANRLYANGGSLYWAGSVIAGGSTGNWTTDGTNAWRVGGNVGIGTTSPFTALSVVGNGYFTGNVTGTNVYGNVSSSTVLATGATTARSLGDIADDVVNVKSFGATGNGVTDDSAAINAAISYIRNADDAAGAASINKYELYLPEGTYKITSPINFTCYSDPNGSSISTSDGCLPNGSSPQTAENHGPLAVVGSGATISCQVGDEACIDGLGSRFIQITGLSVYGDCNAGAEPNRGIQIGRTVSTIGGDDWLLNQVYFSGCYTQTPYFNLASEDTTIEGDSIFQDSDTSQTFATSTGPYVGIWDTGNYWNATSTFVTEQISNSPQSFNDNQIIGGSFKAGNNAHAGGIWIWGTRRIKFSNTYFITNEGACFTIYYNATSGGSLTATSNYSPENSVFDTHCEGSPTSEFFITGNFANPLIKALTFNDEAIAPGVSQNDVFKLDSGISSMTLQNVDINITPATSGSNSSLLWDQPSAYTVSGNIYLPNASLSEWIQPGTWNGCVWIGGAFPSCGGTAETGALNIQSLNGGSFEFDGLSQLYASSTISGVFFGHNAGANLLTIATSSSLTSGIDATAFGQNAMANGTSSDYASTAFGYEALQGSASAGGVNSNGLFGQNTAVGWQTLEDYTTGYENTAIGSGALRGVTTGTINVAAGLNAGVGITTASENVVLGNQAMSQHNGSLNVAIGNIALQGNGNGQNNLAIGNTAGSGDTSGSNNIFLGTDAASTTQTGNNDILIGSNSGFGLNLPSINGSNQLDVANLIFGTNLTNTYGAAPAGDIGIATGTPYATLDVWGPDTASTSALIVVNSASTTNFSVLDNGNATLAGTLTQNSDQRLKTNIQSLDASSSLSLIDELNPSRSPG